MLRWLRSESLWWKVLWCLLLVQAASVFLILIGKLWSIFAY